MNRSFNLENDLFYESVEEYYPSHQENPRSFSSLDFPLSRQSLHGHIPNPPHHREGLLLGGTFPLQDRYYQGPQLHDFRGTPL